VVETELLKCIDNRDRSVLEGWNPVYEPTVERVTRQRLCTAPTVEWVKYRIFVAAAMQSLVDGNESETLPMLLSELEQLQVSSSQSIRKEKKKKKKGNVDVLVG
jgi:hypothetical protein